MNQHKLISENPENSRKILYIKKCSIIGCKSTSATHRVFKYPRDDNLRALWLSFILPTDKKLDKLSKYQLCHKVICEKHFDRYQLDIYGKRLTRGYPCLFTKKEIEHGIPLPRTAQNHMSDHNYYSTEFLPKEDPLGIVATIEYKGDQKNNESDGDDSVLGEPLAEFEESVIEIDGTYDDSEITIVRTTFPNLNRNTVEKPQKTTLSNMIETAFDLADRQCVEDDFVTPTRTSILKVPPRRPKTAKKSTELPVYVLNDNQLPARNKTVLVKLQPGPLRIAREVPAAEALNITDPEPPSPVRKRLRYKRIRAIEPPEPWRFSGPDDSTPAEHNDLGNDGNDDSKETTLFDSEELREKTALDNKVTFGPCRCCLKDDSHIKGDAADLLQCFNMEVSLEPRLPPVFCAECYMFALRARRFRDDAVDAQERLLRNLPLKIKEEPDIDTNVDVPIFRNAFKRTYRDMTDLLESNNNVKVKVGLLKTYSRKDAFPELINTDLATDEQYQDQYENFDDQMYAGDEVQDTQEADGPQHRFIDQSDEENDDDEDHFVENIKFEKQKRKEARQQKCIENSQIHENLSTILKYSTIVPFWNSKNKFYRYDCIYCEEKFTSIEILRNHIDTHNDEEQKHEALKSVQDLILRADVSCIRCKICQLRLNTLDELVQHLTKLHNIQYHDIPSTPPHNILPFDLNAEVLKCSVCDDVCKNFKALLAHMNRHYGKHLCPICGETFMNISAYTSHIYNERHVNHQKYEGILFPNTSNECPVCLKIFKTKGSTIVHMRRKHKVTFKSVDRPTKHCDICAKTMSVRQYYRHMKKKHPELAGVSRRTMARQNGGKPVIRQKQCPFCPKKLSRADRLRKHINKFHSQRPEDSICKIYQMHTLGSSNPLNVVGIPIDATNVMNYPEEIRNLLEIPFDNSSVVYKIS